jgi:acetate kinase
MSERIAVINAGSSSIKFAIYEAGQQGDDLLFRGQLEQIGVAPCLHAEDARGEVLAGSSWPADSLDHAGAAKKVLNTCVELLHGRPVSAIGHRVVHGGMDFGTPVRLDKNVIASLAKLVPLAPLHQPHNLAVIEAIAEAAPRIPQVACFDTAFHRTQPHVAQQFAVPRKYTEAGLRRYGFHGLSYEYVSTHLRAINPELAKGRVIIAHLGNGASLCALREGRSIASTMGFTAVEGLVMGTRCGSIDPGALLYLMDTYGMDARAIEDMIYRRSGLLGVSGISADMRRLRSASDPAASEAIELFVYRAVREIGSLAAGLGGLDGLIFTAGIGQNDPATRAEIAAGCGWLGVQLDPERNARSKGLISTDASRVSTWVIPTDEERIIAHHTMIVLGLAAALPAVKLNSGVQEMVV